MSEPDLLRTVRPLITDWFGPDAERVGPHDNLIEQGLDSIRLMTVSAALRRAGIRLTFAELARTPTLHAWEELLAERCPSPGSRTQEPPEHTPGDDETSPFDLALMQHAYWVGRGEEHELGGVAAHFYNEFDGEGVDPQRLERAVRALLARHAQLRAVFGDDGRQHTPAASAWPGLRVHDLRALPAEEAGRRLEQLRDELSHRMLRVGAGEVFDVQLSLLPGGRTRTHLNLDMLAADALSLRVLLADLAALYRGAEQLPPIGYSYRRYLADRAASAERERDRGRDAAWWAARLPDLPGAPALPVAQGPVRPRVTRRHHWLPPEAREALFARAHRHGVTPAMALAAAYAEVLAAWSAEHRFLLNVPLFDREPLHPDVPLLVGDFTGSVLLTADMSGRDAFGHRARALQERFLDDAAHASYSGVEVLRDLNRAQRGGGRVLAPVVFTSALNLGELFSEDVRACFGRPVWIISQGPQVWLDAQVTELDGGLLVNWDALEEAFPEAMLDAMFAAYHTLVDSLAASDAPWGAPVPDLLPEVQRETRARANATDRPRTGLLLHEDFLSRAERTPDRPALLWDTDGLLTYGELADRARRIAAALAAHAVGPGDRVAVCLPKGPDQIAAVLGILTAGSAYVPVGRDHPPARRDRVLARAETRVAFVTEDTATLPEGVVALTVADTLAHEPVKEPVAVPEDNAAYILFTSGSTGEPKGVVVPHRAARNTVDDLGERFGVGDGDRTLALSALDFDLSVYDLFGPLSAGGAVVLVREEDRRDAGRWHASMARHEVTVLNCVPSVLDMLLSTTGDGFGALRLVLLGGDWVGVDLPGRLAERAPACRFVALGGTTETAIHSTVCEVTGADVPEDWTAVPYGKPLGNVRCRVVDARGRDCPDWVPGELWIGGAGVADGYLGDPGRTADRFVRHDGLRWYRTGDLARYRPGGTVEFLGRADSQVKLRGHRVELGEVEAALERAPGVGRAVAAVVGDADGASRALVAAYAPALGKGPGRNDGIRPQVVAARPDPLEADVVAHVIGRVLDDVKLPPAESMRALVHLWRAFLSRRPAPADAERLTERVTGTRLEAVLARLTERLPDLRAMLTGERDPLELLDDPVLAPEAALDALPATAQAAADCAEALRALAAEPGRSVLRVAVVGARGGLGVRRVADQLPAESVQLTLLDTSAGLLERARERLADLPHEVRYQALPDGVLPEGLPGAFDAVLALGTLHAFDTPAAGVVQVAALLAPGGVLLAVEQGGLPPLGLICAALPTRGFANADPARRAAGSPLLPPSAWEQLLHRHGFSEVGTSVREQEPALLIRAVRDPDGRSYDTDGVRAFAAGQVPSYMVPDRLVLLPVMPLTANGKVDRRAVRELLARHVSSARDRAGQGTPPRPGVEERVAEVWRDLLGARSVHREDDFFALGGDSLLATRMLHRLGERGVRGARIAELFTSPVLKDYAATLTLDAGGSGAPALVPDPEHAHESFPATDVQRAYWLGRSEEMRLGGVGAHYYSEFDGSGVDLPRLEAAWRRLVVRHPMLRAVFDEDGRQRVLTEAEVPDFTIPVRDGEEHLTALREEMSHQVLGPARWPLFDVRAVRYGEGRTRIGVSLDNIVLDGLSMMTVFTELGVLYADPDAELPPVEPTFRDYLASVRPAPETVAADQTYWRDRLPELPPAPRLPLLRDPATLGRPRFTRTSGHLDADRWRRLKERAREHGVTPSTLLLAAYAEVLGTWSESPELTVNLTLFDRQEIHPDINRVLGDFTSLLLAAHRPRPGEDWLTRVRGLQEQLWRDLDHRSVSAVWVMRELARARGESEAAVPVVFTSALGVDDGVSMDAPDGFPPRVWGVSQTPQVWLDLQVYEGRDGALRHQWDAVRELFPEGLVETMSAAFDELLRHLCDGDWRLPRPALLPDGQRAVRERVNATGKPGGARALHLPFFERAAAEPDSLALLWGDDGVMSRGELRERALRIAAALAARGVEPGDTVAVSLPKGPEQICAVLGALAAGAAYVPVGADQPPVRRERMLRASRARCVLDAEFLAEPQPPAPLEKPVAADPDSCAYVIFTSGSTGEPKGVELTHRAAANTVEDINERHGIGPGDRVLAVSALDFDLSVYDIFGLLGAGGALVLVTEEERRDAQRWRDLAARHGVTVWNSVPMLLDMLLTASAGQAPPTLRLAMVSGDWVPLDLHTRLTSRSDCRLIAMGGATEAAIWSNAYDAANGAPEGWPSVPYGTPLRGQRFRVVGPLGEDCPDWVPGELWIGGAGVATGYRGDPERTADRFVTDGGERWYRTGDLGRYRPDGLLEFLGRRDHQLKIRGHRTELGEVDAALLAQPGIARAITVATGPRGQQRLTAFVVPEGPLDLAAVERRLPDHLPAHAVPSAFVPLPDGLPLTANGKVDRAALAEHAAGLQVSSGGTGRPSGPVEELVAAAWRELLGAEQVGRDDAFFALGGDSLLATRLVARLREAGVRGARIATLFTHPVLKDYAATLTLGTKKPVTQVLVSDPAHAHEPFEATDVQRAYWIGRTAQLDLGGVGSHYYSETDEEYADIAGLERAWRRLIARHPMLRAAFDEDGRQRVLREAEVPDFTIPVRDGEEHLAAMREEMSHQVLDPARWPLFDVRAVHYTTPDGERRTRIGVSLDNLILDGLSMMIVFTELRQLRDDPDTELPSVDVTFRDYLACAQPPDEALAADQEYWLDRLTSLPPAPRLPLLRQPSEVGRPRFERRATHLPYARWERLKDRARGYGITPSVLLLAVYAEALGEHAESPELTVNLTLFDRQEIHPDINRIAGDFTSLLLAAHRPTAGESWLARLRGLQARLWTDLDHRAVSAVWVMRQLAQRRGPGEAAMPVVFTSALGIDDERARLLTPPHWSVSQTPQVWLDHQVLEDAEGLRLTWDAVTGLLPDDLPESLMARQLALLEELSKADDWDALILTTGLQAGEQSAVPVPTTTAAEADGGGPPRGVTEELVAALWSELLPDTRLAGREQGFFAAGGDSLLATRLIARLRERTGVEVPLREFFAAPTVATLAAAVDHITDRTTDQNWEEGEL